MNQTQEVREERQMLVAEAMTSHPVTLPPSATVADAAAAMRDSDIGDVLVVDGSGTLCGIVTDRDIAVRVAAEGRKSTTKLKTVLSEEVATVTTMDPLERAVEVMCERAVRRLPVVNDGAVVGVISLGDLAHQLDRDSVLADISAAPPNQ
jgi:CBS domain-containing protein